MTLESVEKLREMDRGNLIPYGNGDYRPDTRHSQIADEIEREISERYMLLPVDANGVSIRVGDMVNARDWREPRKVSEIAVVCETSDGCRFWHMPNQLYHCTRTVEDVLMDVLRDSTHPDLGNSDIIEKYATELRMAGDTE